MHWSRPLRSTLNTNEITGLDMCQVCTEAVHCVALWTGTISQVWTWVKYVPQQKNENYCVFCHRKTWIARACHTWESPKYTISRGPLYPQPTVAGFFSINSKLRTRSLATAETVKPLSYTTENQEAKLNGWQTAEAGAILRKQSLVQKYDS